MQLWKTRDTVPGIRELAYQQNKPMIKMPCDREAKWVTQTLRDVEKRRVWVEETDPQKRH